MSRDKESLNILKKLLSLLNDEENKLLNIDDKNDDYLTNIDAIRSLKKELNEAINNISSSSKQSKAFINGIAIKTLDDSENKINDYLQSIINKVDSSDIKKNDEDTYPTYLEIGEKLFLSNEGNLYKSSNDSVLETNKQEIVDKEVLILGVSIFYNDAIVNIYANYPDYNNTIKNLLLDNGEIISYIVGKPTKKDIKLLSMKEIEDLIIGYYNSKDIEMTKKRGK